jgi:hypothetical protein
MNLSKYARAKKKSGKDGYVKEDPIPMVQTGTGVPFATTQSSKAAELLRGKTQATQQYTLPHQNKNTNTSKQVNVDVLVQDFGKANELLHKAFFKFRVLGNKMIDELINESYDTEIIEITEFLASANDTIERVKRVIPQNINLKDSNIDAVVLKIKLWANKLDTDVNAANNIIFELISSDKWTSDVPIKFKNLYKELTEAVSKLYNIFIAFNDKYNTFIPKTKNVFGTQIHDNAAMASATDNTPVQWITTGQFNASMKSSELKHSKMSNENGELAGTFAGV